MTTFRFPIYEITLNLVLTIMGHSLSNIGSDDSNRTLPRMQMLADGTKTDALSGNIFNYVHAKNMLELCFAHNARLCKACARGDRRAAAALFEDSEASKDLTLTKIIENCAICDSHGFLVLFKNPVDKNETIRGRMNKSTLIDIGFGLGLPEKNYKTNQVFSRYGATKSEGQMVYYVDSRSGKYALGVRYFSAGVGIDTTRWHKTLLDESERKLRHGLILSALRDMITSPDGAMTSKMAPHLTNIKGAIAIKKNAGRAPLYSGLEDTDFIEKLKRMKNEDCEVVDFYAIDTFYNLMNELITESSPMMPNLYD